jgi:hypothetical protein
LKFTNKVFVCKITTLIVGYRFTTFNVVKKIRLELFFEMKYFYNITLILYTV